MNSQLPKHTVDQLTPLLVGLIRFIDDDTLPSEADIALLLMGVDIEPNPTVLREILRWDDILRAAVDNPSNASRIAAVEALKLRGLPEASVLLAVDELASAYFPSSSNSSNGGLYVDASELHFEVPPETVIEKSLQVAGGAGVVRAVGDHIYVTPHQFEAKPTRIYVGVGPLELGDVVFSEIRFICAAETARVVVFAECKQPPDDNSHNDHDNGTSKEVHSPRSRKPSRTALFGFLTFSTLMVFMLIFIRSMGLDGILVQGISSILALLPGADVSVSTPPSPTPTSYLTPTQVPLVADATPAFTKTPTAVSLADGPVVDQGIDINVPSVLPISLPAKVILPGSSVVLRSSPDINSSVVRYLSFGSYTATEASEEYRWLKVRVRDGVDGWIENDGHIMVVEAVLPADRPNSVATEIPKFPLSTATPNGGRGEDTSTSSNTCVVLSIGLNLRTGPGLDYTPPIIELAQGAKLQALGRDPQAYWIKVAIKDADSTIEGWVSSNEDYIQCDFPQEQLTVIP